ASVRDRPGAELPGTAALRGCGRSRRLVAASRRGDRGGECGRRCLWIVPPGRHYAMGVVSTGVAGGRVCRRRRVDSSRVRPAGRGGRRGVCPVDWRGRGSGAPRLTGPRRRGPRPGWRTLVVPAGVVPL